MSKYETVKAFGTAQGPFGFPLPERMAKVVDSALKKQPKEMRDRFKTVVTGADGKSHSVDGYVRRHVTPKAMDLLPSEMADISIITTDDPDRDGEVTLPRGINFDEFRAASVISFFHDYQRLPVGRCLWIAHAKLLDNGEGWKAKSRYTPRPTYHPSAAEWFPQTVWAFVEAGDLPAKSIGYIPMSMRNPTSAELERRPDWKGMDIVDQCIALEYAVCLIGVNPSALVESVAKMRTKGLTVPKSFLDSAGIVIPDAPASIKSVEAPIIINSKVKNMDDVTDDAIPSKGYVSVSVPKHIAEHMKAMRDRIPQEHLAEGGYEEDPHVTCKYGLHTNDPADIQKALDGEGPAMLSMGKTSHFPATEHRNSDVVHCAVQSDDLDRIHAKLSALPHSDQNAEYHPHISLAYVKPAKGQDYSDMDDAEGLSMAADHLCFTDNDGNETKIALTGKKPVIMGTKKKAAGSSESANADGGYAVPSEYADKLPSCPKCELAMKKAEQWTPTNACYTCEKCEGEYRMDDKGELSRQTTRSDAAKSKGRVSVDYTCAAWAESQIAGGRIDCGDMVVSEDGKYFLAHDGGYKTDEKGYRLLPIGSDKGINLKKIGLALEHAEQNSYADVAKAAKHLSALIEKKKILKAISVPFVSEETIESMAEERAKERLKGVSDRTRESVIDRFHEKLGTP